MSVQSVLLRVTGYAAALALALATLWSLGVPSPFHDEPAVCREPQPSHLTWLCPADVMLTANSTVEKVWSNENATHILAKIHVPASELEDFLELAGYTKALQPNLAPSLDTDAPGPPGVNWFNPTASSSYAGIDQPNSIMHRRLVVDMTTQPFTVFIDHKRYEYEYSD